MARLDYPKATAWLATLVMAAAFFYIANTSHQAAKGGYQTFKPQVKTYHQKIDQAIREAQRDISER